MWCCADSGQRGLAGLVGKGEVRLPFGLGDEAEGDANVCCEKVGSGGGRRDTQLSLACGGLEEVGQPGQGGRGDGARPATLGVADLRWVLPAELSQFEFPPADAELIEQLRGGN